MRPTVVRSFKFDPCQGNFSLQLKSATNLDQYNKYIDFTSNDFTTSLIINNYCSLDELGEKMQETSCQAKKYFYLAINKFYIYSTKSRSGSSNNYEELLIDFCNDQIKDQFELIKFSVGHDDHGQLGNFIHPVTALFFKRHDKTSN